MAATETVTMAQHWTNPDDGKSYKPGEQAKVTPGMARTLRGAGYVQGVDPDKLQAPATPAKAAAAKRPARKRTRTRKATGAAVKPAASHGAPAGTGTPGGAGTASSAPVGGGSTSAGTGGATS